MNKLIIISGPTAVGKTEFVRLLSNIFKDECLFEVINADMGQLYGPISIGTAKPDVSKETLKHNLFGIINEPINFSTISYRKEVEKIAKRLWKENKIPIVVGGSGFYIKSLLFKSQEVDQLLSSNIDESIANKSNEELWTELNSIDSKRASEINVNDRYRLVRALNIWLNSSIKPSQLEPKFELIPSCDEVLIIYFTRDKAQLKERIDARIIEMFNTGWVEEVEKLSSNWHEFLIKKKLIGYEEIVNFIKVDIKDKKIDNLLTASINQKTIAYVKKQITFWKHLKKILEKNEIKNIYEINLSEKNYDIESILLDFIGK